MLGILLLACVTYVGSEPSAAGAPPAAPALPAVGAAPPPAAPATETPSRRRSVVLIVADDIGPDALSFYRSLPAPIPSSGSVALPVTRTPRLDALARSGAVFTRHTTPVPLCTPARYTILTGRYASRSVGARDFSLKRWRAYSRLKKVNTKIGIVNAKNVWLPMAQEQTLGHMFQRAGYSTAHVGKWHVGGAQVTALWPNQKMQGPPSPDNPRDNPFWRPGYYAAEQAEVRKAGFNYSDALYSGNVPDTANYTHNLEWMSLHARRFIKASSGAPFFLYFASTVPHSPSAEQAINYGVEGIPAGRGALSPSELAELTADRAAVYARVMQLNAESLWRAGNSSSAEVRYLPTATIADGGSKHWDWTHTTNAMHWLDESVGRLVDWLRAHAPDTVVVFTADHAVKGKTSCNADGTRVPLIVNDLAEQAAGAVVDVLTSHVDLVPTLLELSGAVDDAGTFLRQNEYPHDGSSLKPLVLPGGAASARWRGRFVLCEIEYDRAVESDTHRLVVRTHVSRKLPYATKVPRSHLEGQQLYTVDDVEERQNLYVAALADDQGAVDGVASRRLEAFLEAFLEGSSVHVAPQVCGARGAGREACEFAYAGGWLTVDRADAILAEAKVNSTARAKAVRRAHTLNRAIPPDVWGVGCVTEWAAAGPLCRGE